MNDNVIYLDAKRPKVGAAPQTAQHHVTAKSPSPPPTREPSPTDLLFPLVRLDEEVKEMEFTLLHGCHLLVATGEQLQAIMDNDYDLEDEDGPLPLHATYNLSDIVKWAFRHGYSEGKSLDDVREFFCGTAVD